MRAMTKVWSFTGLLLFMSLLTVSCTDNEVDGDVDGGDSSAIEVDSVSVEEEASLKEISERIRENVNDPSLYIERAHVLITMVTEGGYNPSHVQLALNDVKRAISLDTTNGAYYRRLGDIYYGITSPDEAVEAYEYATKLAPDDAYSFIQLGKIYLVFQDYPKAIGYLDQALQVDQFLPEAYFVKGIIFKEIGDTSKAVSSYETARELNPDYFEASYELGSLYASADDDQAIQYFDAALASQPGNIEALYAKGIYCQEHDSITPAMNAYFEILEQDPNHLNATYNIGYTYLVYLQTFDSASIYFSKVLELQPDHVGALYNLGYAAEESGDKVTAETHYRAVLAIKPDYDLAAIGLSRLGL